MARIRSSVINLPWIAFSFYLFWSWSPNGGGGGVDGKKILQEVNRTYGVNVTQNTPASFKYLIEIGDASEMEVLDTKVELEISLDRKTSWMDPLLVAIHQPRQILHLKLPYSFDDKPTNESNWYFTTKRTLCLIYDPTRTNLKDNKLEIVVTVYTTLPVERGEVNFNITMTQGKGMFVGVGDTRTFSISPTATTYRRFDFDNNGVYMIEILLKADGVGENVCTIIASHDPYCPVFDLQENVQKTSYKKFTKTAVMRQWRDEFPKGFTIVLVPEADDYHCTRNFSSYYDVKDPEDAHYREKQITLTIREVKDVSIPGMILFPFLTLFLPCFLVAAILFLVFDRRFKSEYLAAIKASNPGDNEGQELAENGRKRSDVSEDEMLGGAERVPQLEPALDQEDHVTYEKITEAYDYIAGRKARYCTVTCVVSVYYVIPAFQLLAYHVGGMAQTGNYDRCYYNELCRIRLRAIGLSDFNHVISNGLYVLFGSIFILFVAWRKRTLEAMKAKNKHSEIMRGVQIPYGAYHAMGISLIMEGLLSSAYHLCPSGSTFQFDVAFMNIIAVIIISTLHQLRYRLIPSGAKTFIFLSLMVVISGVFYTSESYWSRLLTKILRVIFCTLHIKAAFMYCVGLYYFGSLRDEHGAKIADFRKVIKVIFIPTCTPKCCGLPEGLRIAKIWKTKVIHRRMKLFSSLLLFVANAGATILLGMTNDFAHHLLFILIMNTMLSFIIYINWKIYHKEYSALMIQPMVYILLAALFGTCAIRKFKMDLTEWNASPAQSRVLNQPCSELWNGYYDHHDVWHFFSAVALFYSFMSLLTIDDGIMMRRRRDIKIF